MQVTLTFDNGPDLVETPRVLDILARHGVKATFFLVCQKLADPEYRRLAERTKAEGHWIGNHTYSHGAPLGLQTDPAVVEREIGDAQALLGDLAHEDKFFRPNGRGTVGGHLLSRDAAERLEKEKFTVVLWSVMPLDGTDPPGWVGRAMAHCRTRDWSSVVVHDRKPGGMDYLEEFITTVKAEGGSFRQDFAADVTPLKRGVPSPMWAGLSNDDPEREAEALAAAIAAR